MRGKLPPNLLYGWPSLKVFRVTRQGDAIDFNDPLLGTCGIRYNVADAPCASAACEELSALSVDSCSH
jgi:hypothetical protein